jgi:hypothetical protein
MLSVVSEELERAAEHRIQFVMSGGIELPAVESPESLDNRYHSRETLNFRVSDHQPRSDHRAHGLY